MTNKYCLSSRILHWLLAFLIIGQIAGGIYMEDFLTADSYFSKSEFYNLHKSFGVVIFALVLYRIINRFINKPPALPLSINKFERSLAHLGHLSLYLLMVFIPLSGYLMSNSYGYSVKLFTIELPNLVAKNYEIAPIFKALHVNLSFLLIGIIVLHIIATIRHRYFDKKENDILQRMV